MIYRNTLYSGPAGIVEDFSFDCGRRTSSSAFQIVLPYAGSINYEGGKRQRLIDANQIVFVTPGEDSVEPLSNESGGACGGVIITPVRELLEDICQQSDPARHPAFRAGAGLKDAHSRLAAHKLMRRGLRPIFASMDELVADAVRHALAPNTRLLPDVFPPVVEQARQLMYERDGQRTSATEIANVVGMERTQLAQQFKRSFGTPMYRYQLNLRLSRALVELPKCEDITELAFALGFSSHSHFTAAFRAIFGITPSAFRDAASAPI